MSDFINELAIKLRYLEKVYEAAVNTSPDSLSNLEMIHIRCADIGYLLGKFHFLNDDALAAIAATNITKCSTADEVKQLLAAAKEFAEKHQGDYLAAIEKEMNEK